MDSMKRKHPKLWEQLKEIAEKHDMKLNTYASYASKVDGDTEYLIGIGDYGYDEIPYILAKAVKRDAYSNKDYDVRETVCFEKNGKLNTEQLEKISNLLEEWKQNG